MPSSNLINSMAELTYEQLLDWVGKRASREVATAALDAWRLRAGLTPEIREAVLRRFKPAQAHYMEPYKAYFGGWCVRCSCGTSVFGFNSQAHAERWIAQAQS